MSCQSSSLLEDAFARFEADLARFEADLARFDEVLAWFGADLARFEAIPARFGAVFARFEPTFARFETPPITSKPCYWNFWPMPKILQLQRRSSVDRKSSAKIYP